jgi:hypothetical protein
VTYTGYDIPDLVLVISILALPLVFIAFGIAGKAKRFLSIGIGTLCVYVLLILGYALLVWPGQSRIVAHGTSPMGREFCIVQTYKSWAEPYQVSFYIRDSAGVWRWNYLAHQDFAWRSATVDFDNGIAHVSSGGHRYREILLPTNTVDLTKIEPGYRNEYCPSNFTAADILSFHNKWFKDD